MKKLTIGLSLVLLLLIPRGVPAQAPGQVVTTGAPNPRTSSGAPTGTCGPQDTAVDTTTGNFYSCKSGAWNLAGGGGGSGTVTHTVGALPLNTVLTGNGSADIASLGAGYLYVKYGGSDLGTDINNCVAALPISVSSGFPAGVCDGRSISAASQPIILTSQVVIPAGVTFLQGSYSIQSNIVKSQNYPAIYIRSSGAHWIGMDGLPGTVGSAIIQGGPSGPTNVPTVNMIEGCDPPGNPAYTAPPYTYTGCAPDSWQGSSIEHLDIEGGARLPTPLSTSNVLVMTQQTGCTNCTLANGTVFVRYTYLGSNNGETDASVERSIVLSGCSSNCGVDVNFNNQPIINQVKWRIYAAFSGNGDTTRRLQSVCVAVPGCASTLTDISASSQTPRIISIPNGSGAVVPSSDTTGATTGNCVHVLNLAEHARIHDLTLRTCPEYGLRVTGGLSGANTIERINTVANGWSSGTNLVDGGGVSIGGAVGVAADGFSSKLVMGPISCDGNWGPCLRIYAQGGGGPIIVNGFKSEAGSSQLGNVGMHDPNIAFEAPQSRVDLDISGIESSMGSNTTPVDFIKIFNGSGATLPNIQIRSGAIFNYANLYNDAINSNVIVAPTTSYDLIDASNSHTLIPTKSDPGTTNGQMNGSTWYRGDLNTFRGQIGGTTDTFGMLGQTQTWTGDNKFKRLLVGGAAPTCSATGTGTSPSCTVGTGSTDTAGTIVITTGTGSPAAVGTLTLTFSSTFGTNAPVCTMVASDASAGQWSARVSVLDKTPTTTSDVQAWDNNGSVLATSTAYSINYHCYAK